MNPLKTIIYGVKGHSVTIFGGGRVGYPNRILKTFEKRGERPGPLESVPTIDP
jgi:hypothetical protein